MSQSPSCFFTSLYPATTLSYIFITVIITLKIIISSTFFKKICNLKNKVFLIAYYSIIQLKIKKIKNEDLGDEKIIQHLNVNSKQHHKKTLL